MQQTMHIGEIVGIVMVLAMIISAYFLPTIVAKVRGAKNFGGIVAVNLLLGWTVIVWLMAFIWAVVEKTDT
jgi:hypothetical protein